MSINGLGMLWLRAGRNAFTLPAGQHELVVGIGMEHTNSFHYGRARIIVPVVPERTTIVYYRAPYTELSGGAIGLSPQSPPDGIQLGCLLAVMATGFVVAVLGLLNVL